VRLEPSAEAESSAEAAAAETAEAAAAKTANASGQSAEAAAQGERIKFSLRFIMDHHIGTLFVSTVAIFTRRVLRDHAFVQFAVQRFLHGRLDVLKQAILVAFDGQEVIAAAVQTIRAARSWRSPRASASTWARSRESPWGTTTGSWPAWTFLWLAPTPGKLSIA
jgi:hypothetical protein